MKSDQTPDWNAIRQTEVNSNFEQVAGWIQKIPFASGTASRNDSFTHFNRFSSNRLVLITVVMIVALSGFIPVQDVEKVGTVVYWESTMDLESSLNQLGLDWLPRNQIVMESYPEGEFKKYAALLPLRQGEPEVRFNSDLKTFEGISGAEVISLEEPIKRSSYSAFFANLPPSLSKSYGMYSEKTADFNRFMSLSREQTDSLFSSIRFSYSLSGGFKSDSLWFLLTPSAATGYVMSARDLQLHELMRIQDAIRLLDGDASEVVEAKAKLIPYYESLSKQIGL